MRLSRLLSGPFRWLSFSLLCVVCCSGVVAAQVTTITGTVYAPNGNDPLPNILVYISTSVLAPFTPNTGPVSCTAQAALVPTTLLGVATTDYKGSFTLTSASISSNTVNLVIQAGKWRRQYTETVNVGGNTAVGNLAMPADSSQGDLPNIAIVTGSADAVECVLQSMGINLTKEVTAVGGTGHINLFPGTGKPGVSVQGSTQTEADLMDTTLLNSYDMLMFGCQGQVADPTVTNNDTGLNNLTQYAAMGGRVFATHYGYVWLNKPQTFEDTADWLPDNGDKDPGTSSSGPGTITVDTSYPEGVTLAKWLQIVDPTDPYGEITNVDNLRQDQSGVIAPTQSWGTLNPPYSSSAIGTPIMQFTFDTPIGSAGTPTVAITYTNPSTPFEQGGSDTVTINVTNTGATAADSSLTLTIAVPGGITPTQLQGVGNTGWTCNPATLTCNRTVSGQSLAAGTSDAVALTFSIASQATVGQASITASLSGGDLADTQQCGRVLFNEYHVETPVSGKANTGYFPTECPATPAENGAEKFLEFSLYNLSNFVSPSTTDTIEIQGPVTLTWAQPAAIEYGTALSSMQLDAMAYDPASGLSVPGTFVYTPPAGTIPNANPMLALSVAFTPTDSTDYLTPNSLAAILNVEKDPTITTLVVASGSTIPGVVTPIYYGQIIGDTAVEAVTSNGPATVDGGNMLYYIDGLPECTLTANAGGACPPPTGQGYNAGTHTTYSMYTGDANFLSSSTPVYNVVVLPDPTSTVIKSSAPTMTPGQSITFTANVTDTYYSPVSGTITFYDGTAPLGTVPATANAAVFSTSNLLIGAHSIKACFSSAIIPPNIQNFVNSCSTPLLETISLPPSVDPTVTVLTSSLNPSVVGQSVTFTATAATTGSFIFVPTGTVTFYDGANNIGSGILTNGVATLTTSTLPAGLHQITAAYIGSTTMAPSTSAAVAQQVNTSLASAGTGFLMSVSPTTFSVGLGSSTSVVVSILELNNFNQPVTLSCSGLPAEATCIFAAPTIAATGGSTPLTVTVSAPHNCGTTASLGGNTWLPIFAAVVLAFFARRRRALKGLLLAAVLCILPAISGCSNCIDLGVKPGTYTFTVVGTAGSGNNPVPVAVPVGGSSTTPSTTTQSQTMTMTVVI